LKLDLLRLVDGREGTLDGPHVVGAEEATAGLVSDGDQGAFVEVG